MGENTGIEWTDDSLNPLRARNILTGKVGWFCTHASDGCRFCYAESFNSFRGTGLPYKPGHLMDVEIFIDEKTLAKPISQKRPRMIFLCSMTDVFGEFVTDDMLDQIFCMMALSPQHIFQVLTKRGARMRKYVSGLPNRDDLVGRHAWKLMGDKLGDLAERNVKRAVRMPLPNVWLGVSAEDQENADERVPHLLFTPAAVRWVSAEPLLAGIDFTRIAAPEAKDRPLKDWNALEGLTTDFHPILMQRGELGAKIDWIVGGCESDMAGGKHARPMDIAWVRDIRDDCRNAGAAFFVKQLTGKGGRPIKDIEKFPEDLRIREYPQGIVRAG